MPKGFPIGPEMAEKNVKKQTDRHFRVYISRDDNNFSDSPVFVCVSPNYRYCVSFARGYIVSFSDAFSEA